MSTGQKKGKDNEVPSNEILSNQAATFLTTMSDGARRWLSSEFGLAKSAARTKLSQGGKGRKGGKGKKN